MYIYDALRNYPKNRSCGKMGKDDDCDGAGHSGSDFVPLAGLSAQDRSDALFRPRGTNLETSSAGVEILAPMVRASTAPLRMLALSYGADLVYTEEIIDRSITTCDRIVNESLGTVDYIRNISNYSKKVRTRMKAKGEVPVVLRIVPSAERGRLIYQMGTGEANLALSAALAVHRDVDGIDVNMGCPKKFSVTGGGWDRPSWAIRQGRVMSSRRCGATLGVCP